MSAQLAGVVLKNRTVSGFRLMETLYSKSLRVPKHDHEEAICCIALTGSCTERYRNRSRDIKPLTVDYLPATHGHSLTFPSVGVRAFSIDISAQWLERGKDYSLDLTESIHSRAGFACSLVMRLYREFQTSDSESSLAIEGLGLELLAEISRQQPSTEGHCAPKWLSLVRDILHEHYAERLRLEPVAKAVGVHPVHLAREFRKHFGCTVGDYLRHLRIDYASIQLLKSNKPLAEIASDAGFADQSHFSRFFKRFTHMTP